MRGKAQKKITMRNIPPKARENHSGQAFARVQN